MHSTSTTRRIHRCAAPLLVFVACSAALLFVAGTATAQAEYEEQVGFDWQSGPTVARLGDDLAEISIPAGYMALDSAETQRLMEYLENPVNGTEVGTIAPDSEDVDWFVVFEWDEIGYVEDDERDSIDAKALLDSIRESTDVANEERVRRGWATMEIMGWAEAPHYDVDTHNLTWAVIGRSEGRDNVNRIVKILGRRGVMTATLVTGPDLLPVAAVESSQMLADFDFTSGHRYAEYVPGTDRLSEIGLSALIVGGTGAALMQTGLLARFWKVILAGFAAVGAGLAKLFGRDKRDRMSGPIG